MFVRAGRCLRQLTRVTCVWAVAARYPRPYVLCVAEHQSCSNYLLGAGIQKAAAGATTGVPEAPWMRPLEVLVGRSSRRLCWWSRATSTPLR